jgi:hypothetical protein
MIQKFQIHLKLSKFPFGMLGFILRCTTSKAPGKESLFKPSFKQKLFSPRGTVSESALRDEGEAMAPPSYL